MFPIPLIPSLVVIVAPAIAAATDIRRFKVYNALTLPMLGAGLLYHTVVGGVSGLGASLAGAALGFCILIVFHVMGGVGAGDVKLMAAVGAWLGMSITFDVFFASAIVQAIYAVAIVAYYGTYHETMTRLTVLWYRMMALGRHFREEDRVEDLVNRPDRRRRLVPFGATVTVGFLATLLYFRDGHGLDWPPYERPASARQNSIRAQPVRNPAPVSLTQKSTSS